MVKATKKAGKIIGPGFVNLVAHNASALMAQKIGQNPPDGIDIDQSLDYVIKNLSKFVSGCSVYVYAVAKAESTLQGATGSFTRMIAKDVAVDFFETVLKSKIPGQAATTADGLKKYYSSLVKSGLMNQEDLRILSETKDSVKYEVSDCPYTEGCKALVADGVPKILGGHECWRSLFFATAIGALTGRLHDYKDLKVSPPKCSATVVAL
jgi:hypothetical protein